MRKVLIDIAFYTELVGDNPTEVLEKHRGTWEHYRFLDRDVKIVLIKFCDFNAELELNGVFYIFAERPSLIAISKFLKTLFLRFQPDFVITHSLQFPFYNYFLQRTIPPLCRVIVQLHSDRVSKNPLKRIIQRLSYQNITACFFAGKELAAPFVKLNIFPSTVKIFEVMEGNSEMPLRSDTESNKAEGLQILWLAQLIERKDPFCLLKALSIFKKEGAQFILRMYFQNNELENQIKAFIEAEGLSKEVILCGFANRSELPRIFHSAQVFVSSSLHEGSGWAVCEAMSAGCWPLLSNIPAHQFMCQHGKYGTLFEAGNSTSLLKALQNLQADDFTAKSILARTGFEQKLSFPAIARDTLAALQSL